MRFEDQPNIGLPIKKSKKNFDCLSSLIAYGAIVDCWPADFWPTKISPLLAKTINNEGNYFEIINLENAQVWFLSFQ